MDVDFSLPPSRRAAVDGGSRCGASSILIEVLWDGAVLHSELIIVLGVLGTEVRASS